MTELEAYYQALTFKKMWIKFRDYGILHDCEKATRHAKFCYEMFKKSYELAGI